MPQNLINIKEVNMKIKMTILGTAIFVVSLLVSAETTGTFCKGVSYTHHDDGTWTVYNKGAKSTWGSGYKWRDLYDTFCE
jgi:hypothetical protein